MYDGGPLRLANTYYQAAIGLPEQHNKTTNAMLTAVLFLLFTILCFLLSADGAWDNETKPERNELVFAGRHQDYGAFALRREYDRRFMLAFLGAMLVMVSAIVLPRLLGITGGLIPPIPNNDGIIVELEPVMDEPVAVPPGPPLPPTPPTPTAASAIASGIIVVDSTTAARDTSTAPFIPDGRGTTGDTTGTGDPVGPPSGGGGSVGSGLGETDTLEFGILEEVPEFIGGTTAMARFIRDNVRFPDDLTRGERVYVGFVVDAEGSVVTVKSKKGTDKQLIREAERVVRSMPKWRPGKLNGKAVPCRMVLPISFETK